LLGNEVGAVEFGNAAVIPTVCLNDVDIFLEGKLSFMLKDDTKRENDR
jgi:hypothetical protein